MVHLLQSTIVSNFFYCVECTYSPYVWYTSHMSQILTYFCQSTLSFGTRLIAKLFHSVHKKLRTCAADFKYYEVADLRLRTSRITKLRTCGCELPRIRKLRTCGCAFKDPEKSLQTCGCGLSFETSNCGLAVAD